MKYFAITTLIFTKFHDKILDEPKVLTKVTTDFTGFDDNDEQRKLLVKATASNFYDECMEDYGFYESDTLGCTITIVDDICDVVHTETLESFQY